MGKLLKVLSVIFYLLIGILLITLRDKDQSALSNFHRRLKGGIISFSDPKTIQVKQNGNQSPLFDTSCPLAIPQYHVGGVRVEARAAAKARQIAQNSGAFETLQSAIQSGSFDHNKIVLSGDSTVRQMFTSMTCHAYTAGLWEDKDSFNVDAQDDRGFYSESRVKLAGGGELIYAPSAGSINYFGNPKTKSVEDWITSCKQGTPFFLDTCKEYTQKSGPDFPHYTADNSFREKVRLGKDDTVFLNSGHHTTRTENISRTKALFECMEDQKAKNNHNDELWPNIYYVRSTPQHFKSKTGEFDRDVYGDGCIDNLHVDVTLEEEHEMFPNIHLVAENIHFMDGDLGQMHATRADCTHYAMPGVPSLYVQEIVKAVEQAHSGV